MAADPGNREPPKAIPGTARRGLTMMSDVTTLSKSKTKMATSICQFEIPRLRYSEVRDSEARSAGGVPRVRREGRDAGQGQLGKDEGRHRRGDRRDRGQLRHRTKGAADYGLKIIEAARTNTNARFRLCHQMLTVKSLAEAVELSTAHTRKQFDTRTRRPRSFPLWPRRSRPRPASRSRKASPAPSRRSPDLY